MFVLIPFYVIESTYDGYLIPFVERETALRAVIARMSDRAKGSEELSILYVAKLDHRRTPKSWSPFKRALLEPLRVGFYAAIILGPVIIVYISHALTAS